MVISLVVKCQIPISSHTYSPSEMATDYGIATVAIEDGSYVWAEIGIWHFTTREITIYD